MRLFLYLFTYFSVTVMTTGLLYKIMHWPGAGAMVMAGMLVFPINVGLFLFYRYQQETKTEAEKKGEEQ